jgi:hypothetical protein
MQRCTHAPEPIAFAQHFGLAEAKYAEAFRD